MLTLVTMHVSRAKSEHPSDSLPFCGQRGHHVRPSAQRGAARQRELYLLSAKRIGMRARFALILKPFALPRGQRRTGDVKLKQERRESGNIPFSLALAAPAALCTVHSKADPDRLLVNCDISARWRHNYPEFRSPRTFFCSRISALRT